ncbi:MAG: arginase family protein [Steroidobacteraceae bacterium]
MGMTRREFGMIASAIILAGARANAASPKAGSVSVVLAPSNLGLRPENDRQPGTWQAPRVLMEAGLADALAAEEIIRLERPTYSFAAQDGTRIRNGNTIRAFSLELAGKVRAILDTGRFPLVVGGDCSILLGCLYGARLAGGRGLVHVDGHSDFTQAASYATPQTLGAAAGMDLALASGRGEKLLTEWPEIGSPLTADADIVQVGERGADEPWFLQYYGDILKTEITQITAQRVLAEGVDAAARRVLARLEMRGLDKAWLHVDLDVLDQAVMPAVDSPGSPGFNYAQLSRLVAALIASGRIAGVDFAIYDPERDAGHRHARDLVACIADGVRQHASARGVS